MALTGDDKRVLLGIARKSIIGRLGNEPPLAEVYESPELSTHAGAFVTLHKHGELRGCIGRFTSDGPLFETITEMALSAAFEDPRFPEVTMDEVPALHIEISVLSPLKLISDTEEITVGTHGIYIIKGANRGVLLPQVATENGFDRETFLDHTCMKAGLYPGAWREGALRIYTFTADIFSEDK